MRHSRRRPPNHRRNEKFPPHFGRNWFISVDEDGTIAVKKGACCQMDNSLDTGFTPAEAPRRGVTRRGAALATFALLGGLALGACSTTDGTGGTAGGAGSGAGGGAGGGGAGIDRAALGPVLNPDQLREALAREGVSDRILFGYDSSDLTPAARATIEKWARILTQAGGTRVVIEGHCDERGTREYNLALGERRATAVRNYLTSIGVAAARVQTISYGKEKPVVVASNEQSWAQNRRGVLAID
jgi:peptidoglycan-associated lipoprotein